jgi:3-oxoacyl-[acyl-carrier protein] reductase
MIDPGLRGRVALVTGANHGIGAATAKVLAKVGTHVFVTYYRQPLSAAEETHEGGEYAHLREQNADAIVRELRGLGVRADSAEIDLSYPNAISTLFDRVESALGAVEILINNAAAWQADTFVPPEIRTAQTWPPPSFINRLTAESHDLHFALNSRATALMMGEFARRHIARQAKWGRIVNISTGGSQCFPGEISYGASKAALESYSRSAARELGPYGITVNIVSPGATQTGWITPELEEAIRTETPLRRIGQPEDVADVILLVVSEQGRWLTGQLLHAGGGAMM